MHATAFIKYRAVKKKDNYKLLTCKVFYIHISSLVDELLDAAHLSTNCCSVQSSLPSFIPFVYFVFGFRCRVWRSLLTQTGL